MAIRPDGAIRRQLRTLFNLGTIGELTDGQLLERFATRGGEAAELAFAALVERHGPMVLRVCRQCTSRLQRCRGCLPGHFPRPGPEGTIALGSRLAGPVAPSRRPPRRHPSPVVRGRGGSEHERQAAATRPALVLRTGAIGMRSWRSSTRRSTGCRSGTACRWCSATCRA